MQLFLGTGGIFFLIRIIETRFIDLFELTLPTSLVKTAVYEKPGLLLYVLIFYFFQNFIGITPHLHCYYHTYNIVLENICNARNLNLNKLKTGTYFWQIMMWFEDILSFLMTVRRTEPI